MNLVVQTQKLATVFVRLIPEHLADKIASAMGSLVYRFSKHGRDSILKNLHFIFVDEPIESETIQRYARNTFVNYGRTMLDFLRLGSMTKDDFSVELIGMENVKKALAHGRGVVLLTMHIGNWDYAGSYLASRGVPMSALVEETEAQMYEFYTKHREALGMKTFPLSKAGYAFLHTIKNNRVLAVLGDRDILKNGITVGFFTGRRNIPRGLGDIIIQRKLPVLHAYLVLQPRNEKHRYLGFIDEPVFYSGSVDEFNKAMVTRFEKCIRTYPDQWMVFESDWVA